MPLRDARRIPTATYRVQLHAGFTLADLEKLIPYLEDLGISDCYLSPVMRSSPGSTHGYDVTDYRKIDPDLGGGEAFHRLTEELARRGMGVVMDFVPNHMGVNGPFNAWWNDVLEAGPHSPHAKFFDIEWRGPHARGTRPRVLVPVLDDHYGRVLERGGLAVKWAAGALRLGFGDLEFPLNAATLGRVALELAAEPRLQAEAEAWQALANAFFATMENTTTGGPALKQVKQQFGERVAASAAAQDALHAWIARVNGKVGEPQSFDALNELIEAQHYRLARWKTGAHEINYRRFFAIDSLAGLRMERAEVFHESHLLLGHLLAEGRITGVRIDHVDGLRDPQEYLERLQALAHGPAGKAAAPAGETYVVVEKILGEGEQLPPRWAAHGTTGYEFITQIAGALINAEAGERFTQWHDEFVGTHTDYAQLIYEKKRFVLEEMFANSVSSLAHRLTDILAEDRHWRDLAYREVAVAVRETMAAMDVYRSYRRRGEACSASDAERITAACARAIARNPRLDAEAFELLRDVLTGAYAPAEMRDALDGWVLSFQQYTGAVMAKAVEDTAFYVYTRFIALNEVGGDAGRFGAPLAEFHAANVARAHEVPQSMVATSTHDTKMSEDVRGRLYALSEIGDEWVDWVRDWRAMNARHKTRVGDRDAPDANEEYRLYQVLLGAWPLDGRVDEAFRQRLREHERKAVNEAQINTAWRAPNEAWLAAGDRFIDAFLADGEANAFRASMAERAQRLAHLGMVNSLTQVVLKCTVPGVPDLYQGNEAWDFSLVDPDNRRPVDFAALAEKARAAGESPRALLAAWRDGRVKFAVTRALLRFRRDHAEFFQHSGYAAALVQGRFAEHVIAFRREHGGGELLVVVPRLAAKLGCPPLGLVWEDTTVTAKAGEGWREVLTGHVVEGRENLPLAELLAEWPVAVLWREARA